MDKKSTLEIFNFAKDISVKAGKILQESQNKFDIVKQKDIQDIATSSDIASEKFLIDCILKKYPNHSIYSEEIGDIKNDTSYRWVIDPLDGTKEYVRGIPQWNCSIAFQFNNETITSCVYRPYEDVLYSAGKGLGSYKNNQKIEVSKVEKLEEAFIYCYIPSYKRNQDRYEWAFKSLSEIGKKVYRLRSISDENTALCWLAKGGCEAYLNLSNPPKEHDILPGLFVANEAGAYNPKFKMPLMVANNKKIFDQISKLLI